jgi:formylglycine-generating enzyme required for sulfatase activity
MKRIVLYLGAIVTSCYIFVCSSEPSNEAPSGGGGDCGCSSTSRETYTAGATAAGGAVDQQSRTLLDVVEALIDVDAGAASVASSAAGSGELPFSEMVYIPGGTFLMGTNKPMIPYVRI